MTPRIYHGKITNTDFVRALKAQFDRGNLTVKEFGSEDTRIVQIATSPYAVSGGKTSVSVSLVNTADGVSVDIHPQEWLGIAASLGESTIATFHNPINLLNRLDDIAQDIASVQLVDNIWELIDQTALFLGSNFELSERLKRYICDYCNTANPPGEPRCIACGAPLGDIQPRSCLNCGYIVYREEKTCPNCGKPI
ncbi:MAG: zinc ribbon domain-containing protein [Anaerolineaceae bacterium]|nr:zinc ribbon domain-containing protein [Anaerolineaceae bacterium]